MAAHDELKQKGNDCIRERNYQEAMGYYTDALRHDPSSHTVYSNRSLAHSKLGRFDAALKDANKCIELAPGFARGYVRKSVALIGQGEYEKAMTASEEGYKLRGSDAICRDCVAQWLEANQAHHKEMVKKCLQDINLPEDIIPKGCRIISSDYLTIFLNILLCRLESTTTGVKVEFMAACILKLLQELDRILKLFGHSPAAVAEEWLTALCLCSKVDPSTYRVPQAYVAALLGKADEFAIWLDVDVDHILYPIVCPIMSLVIMAVTARCISLNVLNTNQPVTLISCQACLPFFEKSLLSTAVYSMQLIALYKELLEAFGGSNFKFTSQEEKFGNECIKKLEALLPAQSPTDADSKDVYERAMISIALGRLRLGQSPGFDPVAYAPESGKAISRSDPEKLKAYVKEKQELLKGDLELKEGTHLMEGAYEDMQDLLFCIGKYNYILMAWGLPFLESENDRCKKSCSWREPSNQDTVHLVIFVTVKQKVIV